jgi:putative DNA primase/helicase
MTDLDVERLRIALRSDHPGDSAVAYAVAGLAVFPLHTPGTNGRCSCRRGCCRNNGKHPRTIHGLSDATTDVDRINRYWEMWPTANIGIRTGERLGVLDVDGADGEASIAGLEAEHGALPPTWTVVTGSGGLHLWFRLPDGLVFPTNAGVIGRGLDLRGRGGYVVAPPSLHCSGARYACAEGWSPAHVPLADPPDWLLALATEPSATAGPAAPLGVDALIGEGLRNTTLTSLAGTMRRRGFHERAIFAALSVENEARCRPPLPDEEVAKIAASVARYTPAPAPIPTWRGPRIRGVHRA